MKSFLLSELLIFLFEQGFIDYRDNDNDFQIIGFSPITNTKENTLSWVKKNALDFSDIKAAVVICPETLRAPKDSTVCFIHVKKPRLTFAKILQKFASEARSPSIANSCVIGKSSKIGPMVSIGHYSVIGDSVEIGDNTIIYDRVSIQNHVIIGKNCIIHSGVVIGGDGFGFEKEEDGTPFKLTHIGGVIIGDNVEVGSNTCIDRGTLEDTVLCDNVKVDNLCQIAHNVHIGKNSIICGLSAISGSVFIGNNVWVSPSSKILQSITIGEEARIGIGSVVLRNVTSGESVFGIPAKRTAY